MTVELYSLFYSSSLVRIPASEEAGRHSRPTASILKPPLCYSLTYSPCCGGTSQSCCSTALLVPDLEQAGQHSGPTSSKLFSSAFSPTYGESIAVMLLPYSSQPSLFLTRKNQVSIHVLLLLVVLFSSKVFCFTVQLLTEREHCSRVVALTAPLSLSLFLDEIQH